MADNTILNPGTGGDTISTDDLGTVKVQRVKVQFGADGAATDASSSNPLPTVQTGALPAGTNNIGDVDVLTLPATAADGATGLPATTVVVAGYDGTNVQAIVTDSAGRPQVGVNGTVPVTDNGGSLTVDGTVAISNPTANPETGLAKDATLTSGTMKTKLVDTGGTNVASVSAGGAVKVDGSAATQPVSGTVTADAGTGPWPVTDNAGSLTVDAPVGTPVFTTVTPSSTGGWSKAKYTTQTTTVQTAKGSAGTFGGYYVYNPNTSVAYVQVFDTAGAVTLGTTVADMVFGIPPSSAANLEVTNGVNMANGIKLACTTTATGSAAPTTGLDMTVFYK